ncbi:DNA polymerase III gamma/tau subunit [Gordonia amarae]|uniref:DUF732 domain-containing protein n=2 Tax=Gordonia amarae TaxID=36821 RepID=G7GLL4_9ACTN|nr:DUF732 domain-containing protein [Gordonia amarae]MCS3876579.1 DNA polymerase III gamma/tau subunit [Gordonia amarae]GAB04489.1 hypothetical protein GOAMR_20_00350 [Gordonia amarae NBRC 15530]
MTTTSSIIRSAMLATGLALVVGAMTACSDDSTASAPLTSNQITTTSMTSSATADKVSASESREQEPSAESSPAGESAADDTSAADAPSAAERETTATKNNSGDQNSGDQNSGGQDNDTPQSVVAPQNVKLTEKQQNYLRALKQQNVTFMGDTDNNVALTMGAYICSEKKKGTDPVTVKAYVTASVGPGTKSVAEASSKADKVIRAARAEYC